VERNGYGRAIGAADDAGPSARRSGRRDADGPLIHIVDEGAVQIEEAVLDREELAGHRKR
jgi:hypothetical protein